MTETKKFPIPTQEQEDIEEALGAIWHQFEEGKRKKSIIISVMEEGVSHESFSRLLNEGYAVEKGDEVALTPKGEQLAKDITRRHRLAERLLTDVLSLDQHVVDPNACQLEHIISVEVSESICSLLGHPRECPHGLAIPPGACCAKAVDVVEPIVVSLDKMHPGDDGKIAYVLLQDHPELHKLLSLGVVPGSPIHLHQTFPTFVVNLGDAQLALEEAIAKSIYVRRG
jgi:DtxR family Mn-dependent transcriptional regulator